MTLDGQTLLLFAVKAIFTASALLTIGLSLHVATGVTRPKGGKPDLQLMTAIAGVAAALMLARLALLNAQLGGGPSAALDPSYFAWTWMALGPTAVATALGCVAAVLAAMLGNRWLAGAAAVLLAAGFGLTGHAAAAGQAGILAAGAALHVLMVGFWIAAPVSLYPASGLDNEELHQRLRRFSRYASLLVPFAFAMGLWLAWALTGGLQPLVTTIYGGLLLTKLATATLALALGAVNQRFVTGLVASDPGRGRSWLRFTLPLDAALFAVAVMAISAATTITGPPAES